MKAVILSDTHGHGDSIEKIVEFAKSNGINNAIDCGDLHSKIECYNGITLDAVYWAKASGAMDRWKFNSSVDRINGNVHENGSLFTLDNFIAYIRHDLANYDKKIPLDRLNEANSLLDQYEKKNPKKRFIFFGHTHNPHYNNDGKSIAINPGDSGNECSFVVLDTDNDIIEYHTLDNILLTIDKNSDIVHAREFNIDTKSCILRLDNGNEVFSYKEGNKKLRSQEFNEIISAERSGKFNHLKVKNSNDTQQLVIGDFKSREYPSIIRFETINDQDTGRSTGVLKYYVASKEIGNQLKEIVVLGEEQEESLGFDKINIKVNPVITPNLTAFIGMTKISEPKKDQSEDNYSNYIQHLVINNENRFTSKSLDDLIEHDGGVIVTSIDEDNKYQMITINPNNEIIPGKKYKKIETAGYSKIINGKVIYIAKDNSHKFLVVDGVEQNKHTMARDSYSERISSVKFIDNKLAYINEEDSSCSVIHDGEEKFKLDKAGFSYRTGISNLESLNNQPVFLVKEENTSRIISDKTLVEDNDISGFIVINNQIIYQKGRPFSDNSECFYVDKTKVNGYNNIGDILHDHKEGNFKI